MSVDEMTNTPEMLEKFRQALQSPDLHHVEVRTVFGRSLLVVMSGPNRWERIAGVFADEDAGQILERSGHDALCWE